MSNSWYDFNSPQYDNLLTTSEIAAEDKKDGKKDGEKIPEEDQEKQIEEYEYLHQINPLTLQI